MTRIHLAYTNRGEHAVSPPIDRREGCLGNCNTSRRLRGNTRPTPYALLSALVSSLDREHCILANPHSALYAHKVNTLFWHDIDDPTEFGFAKHQVTPFNVQTSDVEILYAWHVLPLDVYTRNEAALKEESRPNPVVEDVTSTLAFQLLRSPDSRVVISCALMSSEDYPNKTLMNTLGQKFTAMQATSLKAGEPTPTDTYALSRTPTS